MIEFDDAKDVANLTKHGVSLARAEDFDMESALIEENERNGEMRWIAYGDLDDRLHVLVFTVRDGLIRAISLRKANRREQKLVQARREE